jgi:NADH-quinone oxidoreductase subunit N
LAAIALAIGWVGSSLFGLVVTVDSSRKSLEGAFKAFYFWLAGYCLFVFGLALLYVSTQASALEDLSGFLVSPAFSEAPLAQMGVVFLLAGLACKIGLVPSHSWLPDFYESAPTPLVFFYDTAVKAVLFILGIRLFGQGAGGLALFQSTWVFFVLLSLLGGSVLSLAQNNLRRILAFASIVSTGLIAGSFLLLDGASDTPLALVLSLVLSHSFWSSLAFGGVVALERKDLENIGVLDLQGLSKSQPLLAALLALVAVGAVGLPLTTGFFGRALLFKNLMANPAFGVGIVGILGVLSSFLLFYPFTKIIRGMYASGFKSFESAMLIERKNGMVYTSVIAALLIAGIFFSTFGARLLLELPSEFVIGVVKK